MSCGYSDITAVPCGKLIHTCKGCRFSTTPQYLNCIFTCAIGDERCMACTHHCTLGEETECVWMGQPIYMS
jgi:hypothetical protein